MNPEEAKMLLFKNYMEWINEGCYIPEVIGGNTEDMIKGVLTEALYLRYTQLKELRDSKRLINIINLLIWFSINNRIDIDKIIGKYSKLLEEKPLKYQDELVGVE